MKKILLVVLASIFSVFFIVSCGGGGSSSGVIEPEIPPNPPDSQDTAPQISNLSSGCSVCTLGVENTRTFTFDFNANSYDVSILRITNTQGLDETIYLTDFSNQTSGSISESITFFLSGDTVFEIWVIDTNGTNSNKLSYLVIADELHRIIDTTYSIGLNDELTLNLTSQCITRFDTETFAVTVTDFHPTYECLPVHIKLTDTQSRSFDCTRYVIAATACGGDSDGNVFPNPFYPGDYICLFSDNTFYMDFHSDFSIRIEAYINQCD